MLIAFGTLYGAVSSCGYDGKLAEASNGYPESSLACSKIYSLKQPSTYAIMHSKTGRKIGI
jgi:hypothetical protein